MRYLCTSIVATLMLAGTTLGAIIYVPADYVTIQDAVDVAVDGDVILVSPGTYSNTNGLDSIADFGDKGLTIRGVGGAAVTTIHQGWGSGFERIGGTEASVIDGFTFAGSWQAIDFRDCDVTIENCSIVDQQSQEWWANGAVSLENCVAEVIDCQFGNNWAWYYGGGLDATMSTVLIDGCVFENNEAAYGGAISINGSFVTIINSHFIDNTVVGTSDEFYPGGVGGAIYFRSGILNISESTFEGNVADAGSTWSLGPGDGGAIYARSGGNALTISNCDLLNNTADNSGGAMAFNSTTALVFQMTDCLVSGNVSAEGGGCYFGADGISILTNVTIEGNTATVSLGGGVYVADGDVTLIACEVKSNGAVSGGGGIDVDGGADFAMGDTLVCGNTPYQISGSWTDDGGNDVLVDCPSTVIGACCTGISCELMTDYDCDGTWLGEDTNCIPDECEEPSCEWDLNGDGTTNIDDLLTLIGAFGIVYDIDDLLALLSEFGCE